MNILHRIMQRSVLLSSLGFLIGIALAVHAENSPSEPSHPGLRPPVQDDGTKSSPGLITLKFPGGDLAQLIEQVNKQGGPPFNVIGTREQLAVAIPPLDIRDVELRSLARSIGVFLQASHLGLTEPSANEPGNPVFAVWEQPESPRQRRMYPERNEFTIDLSPYLKAYSVDDIVAALRLGWEVDPGRTPSDLVVKYHSPTKLLFVGFPPDNIYNPQVIVATMRITPENPGNTAHAESAPQAPPAIPAK